MLLNLINLKNIKRNFYLFTKKEFKMYLYGQSSCAGAGSGGAAQPSMLSALIPFILIFVIFYLLIILPQRKNKRDTRKWFRI